MISILLASYNGEKYLAQQIDSILSQTVQEFTLYIQDDCSTDGTVDIARRYAMKYPHKIKLTTLDKNTGSAKYNFMNLMLSHRDDYLMLCDQDDVWLPKKIAVTLAEMHTAELKFGTDMPLLIHTDSCVVNEVLIEIHSSVKAMIGTATIQTLSQLLLQNDVTGGTVLYNRALAEHLTVEPPSFVMHDWWLALVCKCVGQTVYLPQATVLYRQHAHNELGAQNVHKATHKWYKITHTEDIRQRLFDAYRQIKSLYDLYGATLEDQQRQQLGRCARLAEAGKCTRLCITFSEKLFRKGFYRTVAQLLLG